MKPQEDTTLFISSCL